MKSARFAIAACVALFAIGVAGCGSSDDTSSTTATAAALSKTEFLAQGNQICADGNKADNAASKAAFSGGKPSEEELSTYVTDSLVPSIQSQIDAIRALGIPTGDEDQVNAFLDSAQANLDTVKADPTVITSGDTFAETRKLGAEYGLTECASG